LLQNVTLLSILLGDANLLYFRNSIACNGLWSIPAATEFIWIWMCNIFRIVAAPQFIGGFRRVEIKNSSPVESESSGKELRLAAPLPAIFPPENLRAGSDLLTM
jgi:hypothetical protein